MCIWAFYMVMLFKPALALLRTIAPAILHLGIEFPATEVTKSSHSRPGMAQWFPHKIEQIKSRLSFLVVVRPPKTPDSLRLLIPPHNLRYMVLLPCLQNLRRILLPSDEPPRRLQHEEPSNTGTCIVHILRYSVLAF